MKAFNGFVRVAEPCAGGALLFEMPDVTGSQVKKAFGTGLASQRKEKYSDCVCVKHIDTGFVYRLYMCYGEWRVGYIDGFKDNSTYLMIANTLKTLLENQPYESV